jgi:protein SOK2
LEFANKEKITELLYPLFVHNIGALLYHPTNQTRTNQVMAAAERRKQEQNQMRNQAPGLPSLHQHHHHSMSGSVPSQLPGPQHALPPHSNAGRPGLDRAHTFPTPPTSASSVMGGMGSSDGNFQWGPQGQNPLSIDTGLSNARSMPTTPATTPPGNAIQSMQQYQQGSQPYDSSRQQMFSAAPPQQNSYQTAADPNMRQYSQPNQYVKNEMGPPLARTSGGEPDHHDNKDVSNSYHHNQGQGQVDHAHEDENDHEAEYTHGNPSTYDANRAAYNYNAPPVGSITGEHQHLSPEMNTGSPNHPASGRATPRTTASSQPYYSHQQPGYNSPPRVQQQPSSNLYNVMSSERGTANGAHGNDVYTPQSNDLGGQLTNGYTHQPIMNGISQSNKRGRDDEDERPDSRGPGGADGLKRRKTVREGSTSSSSYNPAMNQPRATVAARR